MLLGLDPIGANHGPYNGQAAKQFHLCQRSAQGGPAYQGNRKGEKPSWSRQPRMKRVRGHEKVCQEAQVMLGGPDRTADRRPDLEQRLCHRPPTHIVNCFMPMIRPQTKHKVSYQGE